MDGRTRTDEGDESRYGVTCKSKKGESAIQSSSHLMAEVSIAIFQDIMAVVEHKKLNERSAVVSMLSSSHVSDEIKITAQAKSRINCDGQVNKVHYEKLSEAVNFCMQTLTIRQNDNSSGSSKEFVTRKIRQRTLSEKLTQSKK